MRDVAFVAVLPFSWLLLLLLLLCWLLRGGCHGVCASSGEGPAMAISPTIGVHQLCHGISVKMLWPWDLNAQRTPAARL